MRNKKKFFDYIIIPLSVFIVFLILNYFFKFLTGDEIWSYGFAYNISNGLIPYRDFNMIVPPFYAYILAFLIHLYGNHFILLCLYNAFLESMIFTILFKNIRWRALLFLPILLFIIANVGYNILALLLFFIILELRKSKIEKKDFYVGILSVLLVLTKQTIGGLILVIGFFQAEKKKDYLCGTIPLILLFFALLLKEHAFMEFWDYCLFGMFDFVSDNAFSSLDVYRILYLSFLLIFLFHYVKKRNIDKKEFIITIVFQIIAFPILDPLHIFIAIIPLIFFIISNKDFNKKIFLIFVLFFSFFSFFTNIFEFASEKKYIISPSFLKYKASTNDFSFMEDFTLYLNKEYPDYEIFFFSYIAYIYKIGNNLPITKFDLINNGNMGYHGEENYCLAIEENCQAKKCLFVLDTFQDEGEYSQINTKIYKYVRKKELKKQLYGFDIYTNLDEIIE